jgi:hypothetical protein
MTRVLHRQIYRPGLWGGIVNTTLCGRVRNGHDYNVAEEGQDVTCSFCRQAIKQQGEPDAGRHLVTK